MYNTVCLLQVCFPNGDMRRNWNTISGGHREHLTVTETERRNKRRGGVCVFVGGGCGFNVFVEAKVYSIINTALLIPQPAGRKVFGSSPQGQSPTGVWSSVVINGNTRSGSHYHRLSLPLNRTRRFEDFWHIERWIIWALDLFNRCWLTTNVFQCISTFHRCQRVSRQHDDAVSSQKPFFSFNDFHWAKQEIFQCPKSSFAFSSTSFDSFLCATVHIMTNETVSTLVVIQFRRGLKLLGFWCWSGLAKDDKQQCQWCQNHFAQRHVKIWLSTYNLKEMARIQR